MSLCLHENNSLVSSGEPECPSSMKKKSYNFLCAGKTDFVLGELHTAASSQSQPLEGLVRSAFCKNCSLTFGHFLKNCLFILEREIEQDGEE